MSMGMNESADESDLLCLRRPEHMSAWTLETDIEQTPTEYHLATVQDTDDLVSRRPIRPDFQKF